MLGNFLGWSFLDLIIMKERHIYLVSEQKSILIRVIVFLLVFSFLIPILISWESIGNLLLVIQTLTDSQKSLIFSSDLDRKWIINHAISYYWLSTFNTITIFVLSIVTRCRCITGGIRD